MRLIGIFACFIFSWANAQNLIPNPSFEDANYCESRIPCSPAGWYSVTNIPYGFSANNSYKYKGQLAISYLAALPHEARTYWQTRLLTDLEKGGKYQLRFYLYSPVKKFNPNYLGFFFSDDLYHSKKDTLLQLESWIIIQDSNIHETKKGWLEISIEFQATANAKYMLLGNLTALSNREILNTYSRNTEHVEYFIDDLSLQSIKPLGKPEIERAAKRRDSLYRSYVRHRFSNEPVFIEVAKPEPVMTTAVFKPDTITLNKINFSFDSYELLNKETIINYFSATDKKTISKIVITGYTDSVGNNAYNLRLSENRAISVKKFLVDSLHISSNIIRTEGRGKTNDQKLQEDNRRVELVIYRKE